MAAETGSFYHFRQQLLTLWEGIESSCHICEYPDCLGYITVNPSERLPVLQSGMHLMQVNGPKGPTFVDSYPRDENGCAIVGLVKPPCPYRGTDGACAMQGIKPLTCVMYPLGLEMHDGIIWWALYLECEHVQRLIEGEILNITEARIVEIVEQIPANELGEIIETFGQAMALATWPDGPNRVMLVKEVKK